VRLRTRPRGEQGGLRAQTRFRQALLLLVEQSAREVGYERSQLLAYAALGHRRLTQRVGDFRHGVRPVVVRPHCMRKFDSRPGPLHRLGLTGGLRNRVEQVEKLRERESALEPRASVNDRGCHVHSLEAEHEVARVEMTVGDVLRSVAGEIEAITLRHRHRLGKGGHRPEVKSP